MPTLTRSETCHARDISEDSQGNRNTIEVTVPPCVSEAQLAVLCEKVMNAVPMGGFTVNGKPVKPKVVRGEGWRFFLVPLKPGVSKVGYEIPLVRHARMPFAPKEMTVSSWLFVRQELPTRRLVLAFAADAPREDHLPTPFGNVNPYCVPVQKRRVVRTLTPDADSRIAAADLATIKAAKLHVNTFGVNGEEKYRNKPIQLNGVDIGILPPNRPAGDRWQEQTLDIPKDKLNLIKLTNAVVLTNPVGDAFKIGDVGLAVQLPDGTWTETNLDTRIHCSIGGWPHSEGQTFTANRSDEIVLAFPTK